MTSNDGMTPAPLWEELVEPVADLNRAIRTLRDLHRSQPAGSEIEAVWKFFRLAGAAAFVEHSRLLGRDVTHLEARLLDKGCPPWRDLIDSGSSSETASKPHLEVANEPPPRPLEPQLHLIRDEHNHIYVAVPLNPELRIETTTTNKGDN